MPDETSTPPLHGIRVLDLGQGVAAPYCGLLLAQYGADVIKVEPPGGDWMRGLGRRYGDQTAYSITYNLGKRGIVVDLKDPRGLEVVRRIATRSDVLLENFRPGVVNRLGIGFDTVRALNPKILYCSISGFGQVGPYVTQPGSDTVLQAFSGLISINRDIEGRPHRVGTTMIDALTGMNAFQAVSMELFAGVRSAKLLDVSLLQAAANLLAPNIVDHYLRGEPGPVLNAPAGTYRTADGWVAVSLIREADFVRLCGALGCPELVEDPRFADFALRSRNLDAITTALSERFILHATGHWVETCSEAGVLVSPVNNFGDWIGDPQVHAAGGHAPVNQPETGEVPVPRLPAGRPMCGTAPAMGTHSREILAELAYTGVEQDALLADGVITQAGADA